MAEVRRMRRFRDSNGIEYDEVLDGKLRRRLKTGDKSPIPRPQTRKAIEAKKGPLKEIDPEALAKAPTAWRRRCTRCGVDSCGGCSGVRQKGQRK